MLFDFFNIVAELKKIPRKGWKEKLGLENPESVADHSYLTAVMSMIISDLNGLNTQKVLKMSLLHDLAESIT
jgi:putative hydrolase of HD superfamily